MYSMFCLFYLQVIEKLDLEVLDFWIFSELSILEWFLTWYFKHVIIHVRVYCQRNIYDFFEELRQWFVSY